MLRTAARHRELAYLPFALFWLAPLWISDLIDDFASIVDMRRRRRSRFPDCPRLHGTSRTVGAGAASRPVKTAAACPYLGVIIGGAVRVGVD